jgi:hypothetical protein
MVILREYVMKHVAIFILFLLVQYVGRKSKGKRYRYIIKLYSALKHILSGFPFA